MAGLLAICLFSQVASPAAITVYRNSAANDGSNPLSATVYRNSAANDGLNALRAVDYLESNGSVAVSACRFGYCRDYRRRRPPRLAPASQRRRPRRACVASHFVASRRVELMSQPGVRPELPSAYDAAILDLKRSRPRCLASDRCRVSPAS